MLIELLGRDYLSIYSFASLVVFIPILILVIMTKSLPTKTSSLKLGKIGLIITVTLHLLIIVTSLIILMNKIYFYSNYKNNGIMMTTSIDDFSITKNRLTGRSNLKIFYKYNIENMVFLGESIIINEKEFEDYNINDKIIILIDSKDSKKSIFYKKL